MCGAKIAYVVQNHKTYRRYWLDYLCTYMLSSTEITNLKRVTFVQHFHATCEFFRTVLAANIYEGMRW